MNRRSILRTFALLPLTGAGLQVPMPCFAARDAVKHAALKILRRVRPSDPQWPDSRKWEELSRSTDGTLLSVRPLFAACATAPKGADCLEVLKNVRNPFYLGDQPSGTQVSGWLDAWSPATSPYAVAARTSDHVVAAVNFARENNLRVVVKGGGHSYQGTSNAPDSLLIWTRAMNAITLHERFIGKDCSEQCQALPAVTVEAGAIWIDIYDAVTTKAGRYVQGGGCATVGVAGLVQSGGFGSFSKRFGTAAAGLLEAEIVTADGVLLTANARINPDLFWALKGGGGGSWGVVTKLTLRTHELPEMFGSATGKITAKSDAAFRKLIAKFLAFYAESLLNSHWGESIKLGRGNTLELSLVCQGLGNKQAAEVWQPFFEWAMKSDDLITSDLGAGSGPARSWWDVDARKARGSDAMISDPRPGASAAHAWWAGDKDQVGAYLHGYESLWLPASHLRPPRRSEIAGALFKASRHCDVQLHFNKGLAGAPADVIASARETAMNPGALDAFALAVIANGGVPPLPGLPFDSAVAHADARAVDAAAVELRRIAPIAGSYVSESNYFNSSWQQAFWGQHYDRLLALKSKFDPEGLFFVHHGVGSEAWSADGFTRNSYK